MSETLFTGQPGPKGDKGDRGEGISRGARQGIIYLFAFAVLLALVNGAFTLHYVNSTQARLAQQQAAQQAVQRRAGQLVERALCTDVGAMAAIVPPAGSAAANPSRGYEQAEHRTWSGLVRILDCKELKP